MYMKNIIIRNNICLKIKYYIDIIKNFIKKKREQIVKKREIKVMNNF